LPDLTSVTYYVLNVDWPLQQRPFPLKGRFVANIFIHFEPVAPLSEPDPVFSGDFPPYIIPNSPEDPNWRSLHPDGWVAKIDEEITKGATEAHLLAVEGNVEVLAQLLDLHPQLVNLADENGWTPLHAAVSNLREDSVELLLERGANVHALTLGGDSVLKVAYHFVKEMAGPEYRYRPEGHPMIQSLLLRLDGKELSEL
jgi:hypothetical protein